MRCPHFDYGITFMAGGMAAVLAAAVIAILMLAFSAMAQARQGAAATPSISR